MALAFKIPFSTVVNEGIAKSFNLPVLARIPMQPETSYAVDAGDIESLEAPYLDEAAEVIKKL